MHGVYYYVKRVKKKKTKNIWKFRSNWTILIPTAKYVFMWGEGCKCAPNISKMKIYCSVTDT